MNEQNHTLAIIGCGWLGKHILPTLQQRFILLATTAHEQSAQRLPISAFVYDWRKEEPPQVIIQADYYLIAIPPTAGGYEHYSANVERLLCALPKNKLTVFISSTGIYPADPGIYDENSRLNPNSAIYKAEKIVANMMSNHIILRCGGLFGDERLNGQMFYGKINDITNKRLNLIHYQDIANAIVAAIAQYKNPMVFNLVHPEHPLRHEYYQAQAKLRNKNAPIFSNQHIEKDRIIDGEDISQTLKYEYQYAPTQTA